MSQRHAGILEKVRTGLLGWLDSNEWPLMPPRWWRGTAAEREIWRLRQLARRRMAAALAQRQGRARTLMQMLVWPVWAMIKVTGHVRAHARQLYPARPAWSVWLETYWVLVAYNIRLSDQVACSLAWPENRRSVRLCVVCRELQTLLVMAHAQLRGYPNIEDKIGFARFCREHAVPSAQVVAQYGDTATASWPMRDLIFKPANLGKGEGVERLRHTGTRWRDEAGNDVGPDNLAAWAAARTGGEGWVLQVFLRNAASWQPYTTGALATSRVVTARRQAQAEPEVLTMYARFPLENETVDNLAAGGLGAGVDLATGRLTRGGVWMGDLRARKIHPKTGAQIEGVELPGWRQLVATALAAHRAAGDWSSIGWDMALTEDGPVVIEANLHWAAPFHQPLGATFLPELLRAALGEDYGKLKMAGAR